MSIQDGGGAAGTRRSWKELAGEYFRLREKSQEVFTVDDRTWSDLDMDEVAARLDRALTVPGSQVLYDLLRHPLTDERSLEARLAVLDRLEKEGGFLGKVRSILRKQGRDNEDYLALMLWTPTKPHDLKPWMYYAASYALLLSPFTFLFSVAGGVILLMSIYVLNIWLHYRLKKRTWYELPTLSSLGKLLRSAARLGELDANGFEQALDTCRSVTRSTSRLRRRLSLCVLLGSNTAEDLLSMVKVFFLVEARAYLATRREIDRHRDLLQACFTAVGYVDALQAVLSYRNEISVWSRPRIAASPRRIAAKAAYHPLLEEPVPNDYRLAPAGAIVTGSNMSGKTTFLKTVAVNALLAQTVGTVHAAQYATCLWRPVTAIGRADNLIEGKSYYLDEALAVLRAVEQAKGDPPSLCIMDELFRGTNSVERVAAAEAVLMHLAAAGGCTLVATHDLELPYMLEKVYDNYHFEEEVDSEGLQFAYKLLPGPSQRTNALEVLRFVGYPGGLIERARTTAGRLGSKTS